MPKHPLPFAVCALLLAVVPLHADEAEDQAVKAVQKLGGSVRWDNTDPAKPVVKVTSATKRTHRMRTLCDR